MASTEPAPEVWRQCERAGSLAGCIDPRVRSADSFLPADAVLLLDSIYAGSGSSREDDRAYWRKVARYCVDGGLQAVLDEYIHHLAGESGVDTSTDEGLISLAAAARRATALRESVYRATDIDDIDGEGIAFPSRYALRFGSTRQNQDEARLPEVRAAFNSPFWPFILATTSIGQEGIDFHWWCHSIVHWNLPSNPVDFEQREGRVDRYKGHAIRKNVAAATGRRHWPQESLTPGTPCLKPPLRRTGVAWETSPPIGYILAMLGYSDESWPFL